MHVLFWKRDQLIKKPFITTFQNTFTIIFYTYLRTNGIEIHDNVFQAEHAEDYRNIKMLYLHYILANS